MRVIARKTLMDFWKAHANAEGPLRAWFREARGATWEEPNDVKAGYRSADILPGSRVVFNIKGNTYRLVVKFHYNTGIAFIRFIGTHAEYEKIDAETV